MRYLFDQNDPKKFAPWVRELDGKSGAYRIAKDGKVVYVGSSVGDLKNTITRHVQAWGRKYRRDKPGETFDRFKVKVEIALTAPNEARALEEAWIAYYQPEKNQNNVAGYELVEASPYGDAYEGDVIEEVAAIFDDALDDVPF